LALASPLLLAKRVSLDEAAFLVSILKRVYQNTPDLLDAIGNVLSETLQAVFLVKSVVASADEAAKILFEILSANLTLAHVGLGSLTRLCSEGEAALRSDLIRQIEETGYLGCVAQCMLAWNGHYIRRASHKIPDRHRHVSLKRSGAHYIMGETLEKEEDDTFEFKAVQQTANIVAHIGRICSKYVPAFLNSGGGRIMFGVDDDGKIIGVPLDRGQRDAIRLNIDGLVVEPDPSHLIDLVFCHVIGASVERYVVEVCVGAGDVGQLYCTRAGEHFIRKNSAVYMLKGPALMSYVEQKLRLASGCVVHGEQLRYMCSCTSPAEFVCSLCLLEGDHQGHVYQPLKINV
jgi:hypothetical protein